MGEIVLSNKQSKRLDGSVVTAEERAEYLLKNDYPVPTDDFDELVEIIQKQMDEAEKAEKERQKNENPLASRSA